ncbi:hypothetical protein J2Z69_000882 [Paenibacillus shirakamiensis]|uniref:HTH arsR-type domain-containing protein n=1 Tax=Paenibacillus shirakamiensis TaxID=1265935 RepID=A0ABS4JDR7_9BACL|nr:winged helix-turn-helix domain-containing protein [Paenibacillus shirakamiensis]MBP1999863.1 hypothetical protein [Paenibacillus shirakamiensis]
MSYRAIVKFEPIHELVISLHTYICKKSHKKIDITLDWADATKRGLQVEFATFLAGKEIDADWKITLLLSYLCPDGSSAKTFIHWLEQMTIGELYELIAGHEHYFPENMSQFRSELVYMIKNWNEQYYQHQSSIITKTLQQEQQRRMEELIQTSDVAEFVDLTTNGLQFKPMPNLEELILIPQYHFQPINVIAQFGKRIVCFYSSRSYFNTDEFLNTHDYRLIRTLGEKSRLKILRYLHGGPRSFIEIARHLKLSKGISHDHISKLRSAGLIQAHFEGEMLTEYTLRPGSVDQVQKIINNYIQQG